MRRLSKKLILTISAVVLVNVAAVLVFLSRGRDSLAQRFLEELRVREGKRQDEGEEEDDTDDWNQEDTKVFGEFDPNEVSLGTDCRGRSVSFPVFATIFLTLGASQSGHFLLRVHGGHGPRRPASMSGGSRGKATSRSESVRHLHHGKCDRHLDQQHAWLPDLLQDYSPQARGRLQVRE